MLTEIVFQIQQNEDTTNTEYKNNNIIANPITFSAKISTIKTTTQPQPHPPSEPSTHSHINSKYQSLNTQPPPPMNNYMNNNSNNNNNDMLSIFNSLQVDGMEMGMIIGIYFRRMK